jgi:hypothetical protein
MAKINVEFDTVSKEMSVTMDGKPVEDIMNVSFSKYSDGECSCCLTTVNRNDTDGYSTYTNITAKDSALARESSVTKQYKDSPDMVQVPGKSSIQEEVAACLVSRRKKYVV